MYERAGSGDTAMLEMLVIKQKLLIVDKGIRHWSHITALSELELTALLSAMHGITQDA